MRYDIDSIKQRKQKVNNIKKIVFIIAIIFIYHILLIAVSYINKVDEISVLGFKAYTITTNSMEPNIRLGDVVIVKNAKQEDIQLGDVITFKRQNDTITHRIIDKEENGEQVKFVTKGDNNNIEDEERIKIEQIKGKVVLRVPYLGHLITLLENQIVFLLILFIILIICFFKLRKYEKIEKRRSKKLDEEQRKS